ncbi:unnamed protein product [Prorocentrum cordatum]|uniref:RNase H type-1 domain-containing protein n=1 Tax=Prorocentrum cordatum TaxID=2364126 RepID=A0ABN9RJA2_9DINO|nr:unnamed protein product [Polarella glacialis]
MPQGRVRAWTDGSCLHPGDPLLALAGWGVRLDGLPGKSFESCGPVDGRQTAQRAEVWAAVHACSLARAPLEVVTESRFVAGGVSALRGGASPLEWQHGDLWEEIALHCRSGLLRARWVKSKLGRAEAAERGISEADWAGNAAADELADAGAQARLSPPRLFCQRRARQFECHNDRSAAQGGRGTRRRWTAPGHRRRRAPREVDNAAAAVAVAPPVRAQSVQLGRPRLSRAAPRRGGARCGRGAVGGQRMAAGTRLPRARRRGGSVPTSFHAVGRTRVAERAAW